jgi:hypothetical protein
LEEKYLYINSSPMVAFDNIPGIPVASTYKTDRHNKAKI